MAATIAPAPHCPPAQSEFGPLDPRTDRCDRCGVQAMARVVLTSGRDLLFCGHHTRTYEPALNAAGARMFHDPSHPLPEPSAHRG